NTPFRSKSTIFPGFPTMPCLAFEASNQYSTIMTSSGERFAQILVMFWSLAVLQSAGGQSVTWYEPLPVETVSSSTTDLPPAEMKVFEGYPASLSWNFSLTSLTLFLATVRFDTVTLALSGPGGSGANVDDAFKDRFNLTWISQRLTLVIFNVTASYDASNGAFDCELGTNKGSWSRHIRLKIIEPTKIVGVTSDQDVCVDAKVTLSCNATGKPEPNITWTRVWENGTDSRALQSKDGYFVKDNFGNSSSGTYRCAAFNGVGEPVNQTVKVIAKYSVPKVKVVRSSNVVLEGNAYSLSCEATGDRITKFTWIKVSNNLSSDGHILDFSNIDRNDAGVYKCEASNRCGRKTKTETLIVSFKPDNVTLEMNTTENNGCNDLWVNFTCNSSEASPPVHNYLLLKNETEVSFNQKGTWIEKILQGKTFVYKCQAYQEIDNVTSTNIISLSVKEPPSVKQLKNEQVQEGRDVVKECDVTTGTPPLTFFWKKVNTSEVWYGKPLNITDINRNQSGEYRCFTNNTCGNDSTSMFIDVQFKPDNVTLEMNTTENSGCTDMWVNFTCHSSKANPPVYSYLLLKNEKEILFSKKGMWIEKISSGQTFVYKCQAQQQVGNVTSTNNVIVTVNVPAVVEQIQNVTVQEGGNVMKECDVTAGTSPLTFFWKKVNTSEVWYGKLLNITDIRRNQSGEYRCFANNTCGNDSTSMFIDVQFKPDNVTLERNTTENNSCTDLWVNLTCNSSEANPPVHNYVLIKNETDLIFSRKGTWIEKISGGETFVYKCQAYQQVDNVTSIKGITLNVNDLPVMEQLLNITVEEGGDVTKECNVIAGTPPPTVFWKNINTSEVIHGKLLNITDIRRNQSGEYRCFANNTCGNDSSTMFIDVQYPPNITRIMNDTEVNETDLVTLDCQANGDPSPVIRWIFVSNMSIVPETFRITGKQDEGFYRCIANNSVGNPSTRDVYITVLYYRPWKTKLMIDTADGFVFLNQIFTVECYAQANPPARHEIFRGDGTSVGNNSVVTTSVTEAREDIVNFTCKVSNAYGDGPTVMIAVGVFFAPPAINKTSPCKKYVKKGEETVLTCFSVGHPKPNITWTLRGEVQDSDGNYLYITPQETGPYPYKCKAENGIGNSTEATVDIAVERTTHFHRPGLLPVVIHEPGIHSVGLDVTVVGIHCWTVVVEYERKPGYDVIDDVAPLLRYSMTYRGETFTKELNDKRSLKYKNLAKEVQKVRSQLLG
ncbi:Hemicentin-1, partial [Stylophora pistillata]